MNRLLKLLSTLLAVSSSSVLATSIVSCTVSNNQKVNDETKKDDDQSNNGSDDQNGDESKTDDENKDDPIPDNNDQSDRSNDENKTPDSDNDSNTTPGENNLKPDNESDSSNQNETVNISNISDLNKINEVYLKQTISDFKEIKNSQKNIKNMILNRDLPSNFYSHSDFDLDKDEIILDENLNNNVSLKLINKKDKTQVSNSEIKWYQRTTTPYDEVFKIGENDSKKVTFNLLKDGVLQWKDNTDPTRLSDQQETQAKIYAEYKGYLFSASVRVLHKAHGQLLHENNLARKAAKDIVNQHNWKELPTLERLKQAYNWITKNVKYDFDRDNLNRNQNVHSALVLRKTVCTGYAKGLKMLLEELDIPCKFVEGKSSRDNALKHAWNQVLVDGKWYYVDATSDRVDNENQETDYLFFLNTDDDFSVDDEFTRNEDNKDAHLRNIFFKNFVSTKEDVLGLIDNNFDENTKQMKDFILYTPNKSTFKNKKPNYKHINEALNERGLEAKATFLPSKGSNDVIKYIFDKTPSKSFKEVNIKNIKLLEDKNAIEVEFDQKVEGLKVKNFNITNALIKSVEEKEKSYILNLHHFKSFGQVKVKLESVKRKDYKFNNLKNSTVTFNLTKQKLVDIQAKIISDDHIKLITNDKNLQYSFEYGKWQDVNDDLIIDLKTQKQGKLLIKSKNELIDEIKTIEISRPSINEYQLKAFNNAIVGVNESMEYRKQGSEQWISIDKNKVTNLNKNSTYEVRYKAKDHSFASESVFVNIA
ncbi:MAG6410 family transglutaminase-related lipoprotein [Mycoplasma yeatsii]|uniref:MAG6410 family transglutaminase-related lipoprotein n=1 Tax=Mycoplasma yeatsii TaxID=51365 RepID=UPI0005B24C91|nr:transglutaminase domain-containing protein [Mycoplasma yeatsii]AJM71944.1 lipoprotein [Mycoplasma yeatsii GM274B]